MCKILTIIDVQNQVNAEKFTKASIPYMTERDKDGLGLMRIGENGVYINRWVTPPQNLLAPVNINSPYNQALDFDSNSEGNPSREYFAYGLHARQSTNSIGIANTHPFFAKGSALIHNGVVTSPGGYENKLSTCDSELLLWRYIHHFLKDKPKNASKAFSDITGYYACVVFNNDGIVTIWRDETATLYLAHVHNLGTVISTTSEIILKTCRRLHLKISNVNPILPLTIIKWQRGHAPEITDFTKPVSTSSAYLDYSKGSGGLECGREKIVSKWGDREDKEYETWWQKEEREQRLVEEKSLKVGLQ